MADPVGIGMNVSRTINTLSDLFECADFATEQLGDSGFNLWWRGESRISSDWGLIPSGFRKYRNVAEEQAAMRRFMAKAGSRISRTPEPKNYSAWLYLMQHHGLPTRLLDWTESALVALFFATDKDHAQPGSLTALNPLVLNSRLTGGRRTASGETAEAQYIFEEAFESKVPPGDRIDNPQRVVAVVPEEFDPRMMVQQSMFTLHASHAKMKPLTEFSDAEKILVRFEVASQAKPTILSDLFKVGIRRSALFPDLVNLAEEIKTLKME